MGAVDVDGQGKLAKEIGLAKSTFAINVSVDGLSNLCRLTTLWDGLGFCMWPFKDPVCYD